MISTVAHMENPLDPADRAHETPGTTSCQAELHDNSARIGGFYVILYYTILYYTILYYTILYYTILYYTILYYTIPYYIMLYYAMLYHTILYRTGIAGLTGQPAELRPRNDNPSEWAANVKGVMMSCMAGWSPLSFLQKDLDLKTTHT